MTRLIIGLFAALFVSNVFGFDENPVDWVEPKTLDSLTFNCGNNNVLMPLESFSVCSDLYLQLSLERIGAGTGNCYTVLDPSEKISHVMECHMTWPLSNGGSSSTVYSYTGGWVYRSSGESQSCPPDGFPDYKKGPEPESLENPDHQVCRTIFALCPKGYIKYQVTDSSGNSQCVPINCPSKGTHSSFFNNGSSVGSTGGSIPFQSTGTYCDGKCAYSVTPTSLDYEGARFASGTSLGAVCGDGTPKGSFTDVKDESSCTTNTTSSGSDYIECSQPLTPEEPTPDGDEFQGETDPTVGTDEPQPYVPTNCVAGASGEISCVGSNIVEAINNQSKEQNVKDVERHNKLVKQQKEITNYVEARTAERFAKQQQQSASNTQAIITAIGGSFGGGVGTGGGTGEEESLTEDYNPDGQQVDDAFNQLRSELDTAQADLENTANEKRDIYSPESSFWNVFKGITEKLPSEAACAPIDFSFKDHSSSIDICEHADLIKAFLAFDIIFLTLMRVFYQVQRVMLIVASTKA